ncbi:hypothetical protein WJX81_001605 [Elliptochloris bilobata]|uniref:Enhancer of rudimentary homolog n=1 Tax=Elliptochloris bilobata TaxID=381761 RepID=A0AAW1QN40_9CHLO
MTGLNSHTIILLQPLPDRRSRTFLDFDTVGKAIDGVCGLFEKRLKELNPTRRQITYDVQDLFTFIDHMQDMSALV